MPFTTSDRTQTLKFLGLPLTQSSINDVQASFDRIALYASESITDVQKCLRDIEACDGELRTAISSRYATSEIAQIRSRGASLVEQLISAISVYPQRSYFGGATSRLLRG